VKSISSKLSGENPTEDDEGKMGKEHGREICKCSSIF
jgi:hypothetical protein